jgi:AraC-like DNA-binding protein
MQALDYMVKFNPKDFHTTKNTDIKLYPKLIRLMVNGQTIQPGMEVDGKLILDRAITRAKEFSVNYDQNTISLLFSGLNYFRPAQTYYRIRVKGFHNEWEVYSLHDGTGGVDSQGMLLYPIIGIPPGKYEIEVQASMTPDNWQVEPYVWKLSVDEPWWRMTIVYVTLGGLLLGMLITNFVFYNRITRLKLKRGNVESGIIKRVKSFSVMCESMENEQLSASLDIKDNSNTDAEDVFSEIMLKVLPYVRNHPEDLTIAQLAKEAQMDMKDFYGVMSSNLYRTPRALVLRLRLQRVAELLRNSDKTVDEIAEDLNFESANYLIASFYHQYRQTPDDYRATNPR